MRRPGFIADEHGVATVIVALSLPFLLLFAVLAVDVGNWFVHKRHLQVQADAAALAGAGVYRFPACDNTAIRNTALAYSGVGGGGNLYNSPDEVKTSASRLHANFMRRNYFGQSKPNETDLPATGEGDPCTTHFVDVKMTETDLPWIFGSNLVPNINAQARVKLFQVNQGEGLLPLGVQEAAPRNVRAFVVDESTGTSVASVVLTQGGTTNGLQYFHNEGAPLALNLPAGTSSNLGVRLALSGSSSTTCGDQLVNCYDNVATTQGLSYIRTWAQGTDPTAGQPPIARSISLSPATCLGSASFNASTTACTFNLVAAVKFNPSVTATEIAAGHAILKATMGGTTRTLTYNTGTQLWSANFSMPVNTIGPAAISLTWEQQVGTVSGNTCGTTGGNKCKDTFGTVQRTYWNDPNNQGSQAGPVGDLQVLDSDHTLQQVSSLQRCAGCVAHLVFEVGIKGALSLDQASDPPRSMRVAGSSSQNQTLDCDPARNFIDEIAYGCQPKYARNKGTPCTAPTTPLSCVPVATGTTANKPAQGFNIRILCSPPGNPGNCKGGPGPPATWDGKPTTCPAAGQIGHNNWPNYPQGDPRLVAVFLVPFGTFELNGSNLQVPIIDFGAFYVTGWASNGAGFANPCIGNGDQFVPGTSGDNGVISGHFVKNVDPNITIEPDTETCDFNDIGQCVAVLVK